MLPKLPRIDRSDLSHWWQLTKQAATCSTHDIVHEGQPIAHLGYFAAVFFEGHGYYAGMGGVLFVLGTAALIFKDNTGD